MNTQFHPSLSVVSLTVPAVGDTRGLGLGTGGAMRHCPRPSRVGDDAHGTAPFTPAAVTTPTGHMSGVTAADSHHPRYSPRLCVAATDAQVGAASTCEPFGLSPLTKPSPVGSQVAVAATVAGKSGARCIGKEGTEMPHKPALTRVAEDLLIDAQIAIASGDSDRAVAAVREAAHVVKKLDATRLSAIYALNHGEGDARDRS